MFAPLPPPMRVSVLCLMSPGKRIVPDVAEELAVIREARARADRAVLGYLNYQEQYIRQLHERPVLTQPETDLGWRSEDIFRLRERAARSVEYRVARERDAISHTIARVRALSPVETLKRGYTIVQRADGTRFRIRLLGCGHSRRWKRSSAGTRLCSVPMVNWYAMPRLYRLMTS